MPRATPRLMAQVIVVGTFRNDRRAAEAMRSLDAAGFDADRVRMTGDDPVADGGTIRALAGGILGAIVALAVVAGFTVWGDLATDPLGLVVGAIGVIGGMAAVGSVVGRASGRHAPEADLVARVVQSGAIVSVRCADDECELAARVLDGSGAREVRDEAGSPAV